MKVFKMVESGKYSLLWEIKC